MVTGAPRSGTTFLGAMLALAPGVISIEEPFNFETGIVGMDRPFLYMPTHAKLNSEDEHYVELINELFRGEARYKQSPFRQEPVNPLRQLARSLFVSRQNLEYKLQTKNPFVERYVIKDANACFMAEFMDAHFQTKTMVIMRHPVATIASYKRLGWHYDLSNLKEQPALMHDFLEPIIGKVNPQKVSPIEAWAYLWLCVYTVLTLCSERDSRMMLITHDQLSQEPMITLQAVYEYLGLAYTPAVEAGVERHTNGTNPTEPRNNAIHDLYRNSAQVNSQWKSILNAKEVATIRKITEPLAHFYFDERSWKI